MMRTLLAWLLAVVAFAAPVPPVAAAEPDAGGSPDAAAAAAPIPMIGAERLLERIAARDAELVILDVRTPAEYAAGHVEGAINVPHDALPARAGELPKHREIVLYCRSGRRTGIAAAALRAEGFPRLLHLEGDMLAWEAAGRPLVTD